MLKCYTNIRYDTPLNVNRVEKSSVYMLLLDIFPPLSISNWFLQHYYKGQFIGFSTTCYYNTFLKKSKKDPSLFLIIMESKFLEL